MIASMFPLETGSETVTVNERRCYSALRLLFFPLFFEPTRLCRSVLQGESDGVAVGRWGGGEAGVAAGGG